MGKQRSSAASGPAAPPGRGKRGAAGHIGYLLRQAQFAARQAFEAALADLRLTLPQFSVLTVLDAHGARSGAELARITLLTPQTVDVILRNLERAGLIERTPDPAHGRIRRAGLSRPGRRRLAAAKRRVAGVERRMTAGLAPAAEKVIRIWLVDIAREFIAPAAGRR